LTKFVYLSQGLAENGFHCGAVGRNGKVPTGLTFDRRMA
jgi:hypothetical protein